MSWRSRMMNVFRQGRVERVLDDEMAFHIESRIDDLVKSACQRRRLLVEVLRQGLTLTAAGIAAGLVVALGLNRALGSLLFGVTPADPLTFAIALPAIVAVAAVASWFPAWRASRLDPLAVLRAD